jgi:hypothetical protein
MTAFSDKYGIKVSSAQADVSSLEDINTANQAGSTSDSLWR